MPPTIQRERGLKYKYENFDPNNAPSVYVGRRALLMVHSTGRKQPKMFVPVKIKKAKTDFGKLLMQVEPLGGRGRQWVESRRLQLIVK